HRGGDDVGVRHRGRVQTGGHQAGEVRHVHPQLGPDLVGDLTEGGEVEVPRVGGPARDDDVGTVLQRLLAHLVHLDAVGLRVHAVGTDVVQLAAEVDLHAVREVAAVGQLEAEDLVARVDEGVQHGRVGLGARVRPDVRVLGAEQLLGAGDREVLRDVDLLAAAVVATARVALRVLVGQHGAL